MIKRNWLNKIIFVLLICIVSVDVFPQKCQNWSIKASYHCTDVEAAKLVVFHIKNTKTKEKPDSVIYKISNRIYNKDTILLEEGNKYQIKLRIYKNNKVCRAEKSINVPKKDLKANFLMSDSIFCEGDLLKMINTSGPSLFQSVWTFENGDIVKNITNPVYQFENIMPNMIVNVEFIILTVIDRYGCKDSKGKIVTVHPNKIKGNYIIDSYNKEQKKIELKLAQPFNLLETHIPSKYLWSTKESKKSIVINEAGYYWLKIEDEFGCWDLLRHYVSDELLKHPNKYY